LGEWAALEVMDRVEIERPCLFYQADFWEDNCTQSFLPEVKKRGPKPHISAFWDAEGMDRPGNSPKVWPHCEG